MKLSSGAIDKKGPVLRGFFVVSFPSYWLQEGTASRSRLHSVRAVQA